jgi:hypothetical protein
VRDVDGGRFPLPFVSGIRSASVRLFFCVLIVLVGRVEFVRAQGQLLGAIHGTIKDEQGGVLPGVVITVTPTENRPPISVVTSSEGFYSVKDLEPGQYAVKAELPGFATLVQPQVSARAGLTLSLDLVLKVGGVGEIITVRHEAPLLETASASAAVNISGDFQRSLPTSQRRNWSDALILVPGVVSGDTTLGGLTQNYYVHGSNATSHVLQLDGADIASAAGSQTLYIAFNTDIISDVQIRTAGVDASAPLGTGAVFSVATKSGTNTLSGSVGTLYQAKGWNSSNVPGGTSSKVSLIQPDLSIGGPLQKDRAWYFGAFRRTEAESGVARTATQLATLTQLDASFRPFDVGTTANLYFAKVTARLSDRHRISGFVQSDATRAERGSAQDSTPAADESGGLAVAARLSSTWGSSITSELGLSYNNKHFQTVPVAIAGTYDLVYRSVVLSGGRWLGTDYLAHVGAEGPLWTSQPSTKSTISYDLTSLVSRRGPGTHTIKFGVFLQPRILNDSTIEYTNGGAAFEYQVLKDPNNPAVGTTPFERIVLPASTPQYRSTGSDLGGYVQDSWMFRRLSATVGLRIDRVRYDDRVFNVTTQNSANVGPRIGVNLALREDARSVARLTWSRVPDRVAGSAFAGTVTATQTSSYDLNLDGVFETVDVTPGSLLVNPARIFDPDLHQPYVNEVTAGFRQQLGGQTTIDLGLVQRHMRDRFTMVEVNGLYEGNVFKGYADESQSAIYKLTNNVWNWPIYTALEVTATKRTARVELIGSYTRQWQHLDGTWTPNDPALFIQPTAFPDNRGIGSSSGSLTSTAQANSLSGSSLSISGSTSSPWQDHVFRSGINVVGPWNTAFAANYTYQSGPWSGPIVKNLSAPDPAFGPSTVRLSTGRIVSNPLATPVRFAYPTRSDGQFHLDSLHVLSVRVVKTVNLGSRKLAVTGDVFNVSNNGANQGLISGGNVLGGANYGIGQNRQLPRGGQVGVRFTF